MGNVRLLALVQAKDQAWIIERFLQRTCEIADALVVLDDGSTDGTFEILQAHPKVIRLLRNPPGTPWNEVKCHRRLLSVAHEIAPEWIMNIDTDEILDARFVGARDEYLERSDVGRYHFKEITLWNSIEHYRVDKPDWYMRETGCSPILLRYTPTLDWSLPHLTSWKAFVKHSVKSVIEDHRLPKYYSVGIRKLSGQLPNEEKLPFVKLHYHFADRELAWRKHLKVGIIEAIQRKANQGEVEHIMEFVTRRLDETGLELAAVDPAWGAM